jgi:hypothetical protein
LKTATNSAIKIRQRRVKITGNDMPVVGTDGLLLDADPGGTDTDSVDDCANAVTVDVTVGSREGAID